MDHGRGDEAGIAGPNEPARCVGINARRGVRAYAAVQTPKDRRWPAATEAMNSRWVHRNRSSIKQDRLGEEDSEVAPRRLVGSDFGRRSAIRPMGR